MFITQLFYLSECLLNLYSLCLLVVVILQVLLAIFVLVYNEDIKKGAYRGWDRLWEGKTYSELNRSAIDQIQRALECCGSQSFLDYGITMPSSCCSPDAQLCNQLTSYHVGCKSKVKTIVEDSASWIAYLSIAMAVVEVNTG